jgi:hypothetical protein
MSWALPVAVPVALTSRVGSSFPALMNHPTLEPTLLTVRRSIQ